MSVDCGGETFTQFEWSHHCSVLCSLVVEWRRYVGSSVGRRWCVYSYTGIGMSCMKRLKWVGESTDPRGICFQSLSAPFESCKFVIDLGTNFLVYFS